MTDAFPDSAPYIPLEPGGSVYLFANHDAMPIVNNFSFNNINNKQFQQMVDLTQFAVAAIYPPDGEINVPRNRRYRLAAWGNYPVSRAKMALGASKDWKKQRSPVSGAEYWYAARDGLSIAMIGERALVATAAGDAPYTPVDPFSAAPGTALPEGFSEFRKEAVLACWLDDPGPVINRKLTEMGIPLELPAQQLFISLFPAGGAQRSVEQQRYEARIQIQVANASQARSLAAMFAIARNFIPPQADSDNSAALLSVLFANPPVPDGKNLNITTAPLSAGEIALLVKRWN